MHVACRSINLEAPECVKDALRVQGPSRAGVYHPNPAVRWAIVLVVVLVLVLESPCLLAPASRDGKELTEGLRHLQGDRWIEDEDDDEDGHEGRGLAVLARAFRVTTGFGRVVWPCSLTALVLS